MPYCATIKGVPCRGETLETILDLYRQIRDARGLGVDKCAAVPVYVTGRSEPAAFITSTRIHVVFPTDELKLIGSLCEMHAEVLDQTDPNSALAAAIAGKIRESK